MLAVLNRIILVRILIFIGIMKTIKFKLIANQSKSVNESFFLFFYSRGTPWDKGFDLTQTASDLTQKLNKYFSKIIAHNKQTLKKIIGSEEFCNEYDEPLDKNPNANYFGYFDFKPFLINNELNKLQENEILFYHDGNFVRNYQYWESDWENIDSIIYYLMDKNKSSIWVQFEGYGNFVRNHVKDFTLSYFFNDKEKKIIKKSYLINAARVIVRNDEFGRRFIYEYMKHCKNKNLISRKAALFEDKNFLWSCGDQDVLNCLVYRNILDGNLDVFFPRFSFFYRVMRLERKKININYSLKNGRIKTGIYPLYNFRLIFYVLVGKLKRKCFNI
jgi:hypothetical protein